MAVGTRVQTALDRPLSERTTVLNDAQAGEAAPREAARRRPVAGPMTGQRLGAFEIDVLLGVGGMGAVYRARDTRLGRDVALKLLPPQLLTEPDRLARVEREARMLASLNHVNIAAIYGVEEREGTLALVLELVEGETLADRLMALPGSAPAGLPVSDALPIAQQILDGLEAAHQKGIIHRDLKPANIKVTPEGLVKLLDFGLAKAVASGSPDAPPSQATTEVSHEGQFVGTPAYMSPEQVRGRRVDARTDLWAFGCVLFELLARRQPFARPTVSDTIAAILERDPDWSLLPASTPPRLRVLIRRCLAKDPALRLATASEARPLLLNAGGSPTSRRRLALAAAVILLAGAGVARSMLPRAGTANLVGRDMGAAAVSASTVIAVLPFEPSVGGADERAYALGLSVAFTEQLRQSAAAMTPAGSVLVVPAAEISEGDLTTVERAQRTLGATATLTGRITRASNTRRVALTRHEGAHGGSVDRAEQDATLTWESSGRPLLSLEGLRELLASAGGTTRLSPARHAALGGTTRVDAEDAYLEGLGYSSGPGADLDRALDALQRATTLDPQFALAFAATTDTLLAQYRVRPDAALLAPAAANADTAIALAPDLAAAHVLRGRVYRASGQNELATRAFHEALQTDDQAPGARRGLSEVFEAEGNVKSAEEEYRRQIADSPRYWSPHINYGSFLIRYGRYRDAETSIVTGLTFAPDNPRAIGNLAGLYALTERLGAADAELRRAVKIRPDVVTYNNLAWVQVYQGHFTEALPWMEQAVHLPRSDSFYWGNLARMYRWAGRRGDATTTYDKALRLAREELAQQPTDLRLRGNYAQMLAEVGRRGDAVSEITSALALAPRNVSLLFRKALVHELNGDRTAALQALEAASAAGYSRLEINHHPALARLRSDPGYTRIAAVPPVPGGP